MNKSIGVSAPNLPAEHDQDAIAGPNFSITSRTMGGLEEAWFMIYWPLKYYGFAAAASIVTKDTFEYVNACPFSVQDKSDFKSWLLDAQSRLGRTIEQKYGSSGYRPDLPGGPSRSEAAKDAQIIQKLKASELWGNKCVSGGALAI